MDEDSTQVLKEKLKCFICQANVKPGHHKWYRCLENHFICWLCVEDGQCSCREQITKSHCPMIEALLRAKTMTFECFNKDRGCNEVFGEEDLTFHCFQCTYRLVSCPNLSCKSKVPFHQLLEHIETQKCSSEEHYELEEGVEIVHTQTLSPLMFNSFFPFSFLPKRIEFDEKLFFFTGDYLKDNETFYFWIQVFGSKYEAKDYYYKLKIHGTDPNTVATYNGQAISIDENTSSSFGVHIEPMRRLYLDEKRSFIVSISMRKLTITEPKVEIFEMEEAEYETNYDFHIMHD